MRHGVHMQEEGCTEGEEEEEPGAEVGLSRSMLETSC